MASTQGLAKHQDIHTVILRGLSYSGYAENLQLCGFPFFAEGEIKGMKTTTVLLILCGVLMALAAVLINLAVISIDPTGWQMALLAGAMLAMGMLGAAWAGFIESRNGSHSHQKGK